MLRCLCDELVFVIRLAFWCCLGCACVGMIFQFVLVLVGLVGFNLGLLVFRRFGRD